MTITGKVLSAESTKRSVVGKDGNKRDIFINRVVVHVTYKDGKSEVASIKSFVDPDQKVDLPKVGTDYSTSFRKYELKDGIADVLV